MTVRIMWRYVEVGVRGRPVVLPETFLVSPSQASNQTPRQPPVGPSLDEKDSHEQLLPCERGKTFPIVFDCSHLESRRYYALELRNSNLTRALCRKDSVSLSRKPCCSARNTMPRIMKYARICHPRSCQAINSATDLMTNL